MNEMLGLMKFLDGKVRIDKMLDEKFGLMECLD
jgi:hypothetical protein